ncbi:hypothetical protein [Fusibacter tunisiensis]|uniref:DUF4350 domain-containing protein n=1 Tax=Fusibacter tunisiensis TaxID=1008308 RepID=A0ABS2MSS5_9FIRM|nr:hypothetical protein [Fusibacter tunisiensis]MBM7562455.1 hypothetical protein [Fusibacter tunisiensis]
MKSKRKKKSRRIRNLLILALLVILLLLLDGRLGLGGQLGNSTPNTTPSEVPETTNHTSTNLKQTLRVSEDLIFLNETSIELTELGSSLQKLPKETLIVLEDDFANNRIFEAVESILIENDFVYTIKD